VLIVSDKQTTVSRRQPLYRAAVAAALTLVAMLPAVASAATPEKMVATPAVATPAVAATSPGQSDGRLAEVTAIIAKMTGRQDLAKFDRQLQTYGLTRLSTAGSEDRKPGTALRAASSATGDAAVPRPYAYFDSQARAYYIVAKYDWIDYRWNKDKPRTTPCNKCNIGGTDGFALRFNRGLLNIDVSAIVCGIGKLYRCHYPDLSDNSSSGTAINTQDQLWWYPSRPSPEDYNWDHGVLSMKVGRPPCGAVVQMFSAYAHTWSGAKVNGFSIGPYSFGLQWGGNDNHWVKYSQSGTWRAC
jgi:hypothetical protein